MFLCHSLAFFFILQEKCIRPFFFYEKCDDEQILLPEVFSQIIFFELYKKKNFVFATLWMPSFWFDRKNVWNLFDIKYDME